MLLLIIMTFVYFITNINFITILNYNITILEIFSYAIVLNNKMYEMENNKNLKNVSIQTNSVFSLIIYKEKLLKI